MLTLTPQAADQVRHSLDSGNMHGLALRIAAQRRADGSIDYRMGFDEVGEGDLHLSSEGVDLVVKRAELTLLNGTTMDYVEIEPGEFRFIFMNPNDPTYTPPQDA